MYTLNAVKLRNELNNRRPGLVIEVKNVRINGVLQGCSGFITDPATGAVIYVSTDRNHGTVGKALYRRARDTKDYTGLQNNFCEFGELSEAVVDMFEREVVLKAAKDSGRLIITRVGA